LSEDLPLSTIDGKWVKDPAAFVPDAITSGGLYDSIISYTSRLGFKAISLYDQSFLRADRGNEGYIDGKDFEKKPLKLTSGNLSHKEFSDLAGKYGITIGRTPITTAIGPRYQKMPVPFQAIVLCYQQKRLLMKGISPTDTIIIVDDPKYMDEIASWEGHAKNLNMVKIGKELNPLSGYFRRRALSPSKCKEGLLGHHTYRAQYQRYHIQTTGNHKLWL